MEEAMDIAMNGSHDDVSGGGGGGDGGSGGGGGRRYRNTWQLITKGGKTVVATYPSATAAGIASGSNAACIGQVCLGHAITTKGKYYWRHGPPGEKLSIDCQDEDSTRAAYDAAVKQERIDGVGDDEPIGKLIALE